MADNRTEIRVRLTPEGRAILGDDEWAILDLAQGFSTRVSKDVNGLSDVNLLLTDGVLSFSVPYSTTNDAAFISFSSPIITDNPDLGIEARIVVDSHELPFDRIWIKQKNDTSAQWEISVRRSPNHWLELSSVKKLCDIDCGTALLDFVSVVDGFASQFYVPGESVVRWIPTDYGGWVDLSEPAQFTDPPVKQVWLEDLRPWVSKVFLLKQGFCEIGWTLKGQIFEAPWTLAQFDYVLGREYYNQSEGGLHKLIGQNNIGFTPNSTLSTPFIFDLLQYDPGTNNIAAFGSYAGGITNNLPFKSKYRFQFSGYIENTTGADKTLGVGLGEFDFALSPIVGFTGLMLYDTSVIIPAGSTTYVTVDQIIELEVGQGAAFIIGAATGLVIKIGARVIAEPANKSLVRGDVVTVNKMFDCDLTLLDYTKGFVHEIGGRIETDWNTREVTIHPYRTANVYGDSVPGFIQDGETSINIDGKIICDSIQMSRVKNTLTRYTQIAFADATDAYIQSLDLPQPPHSRKVLNGVELPDQIQELKNPFFEPTLEGLPESLRRPKTVLGDKDKPMAYFPRLWDNMEGERSFAIKPRTLMFFGDVRQFDIEKGEDARYYLEDGVVSLAYGSQLPTRPFSTSFPPTLEGSTVYGTTESDLYVTFYLGLLQRQKRGVYIDALVLFSSNDYAAWNFRVPFAFNYKGRPVVALGEKISDFAHALDTSTPMRLLVEPSDTQCCDLPCSCRFKECDYYQDFGQFITQDTLDDLSVTSFKVNGIERLTSPVDFGIIKIVQMAGKPFVTNLVDTLNALAIDYFTFRPSTKDFIDKLDARYFKIKWPSCWSFEIIISDTGGEVYRYRDFDQAQQWFDATWEGFGYSNELTVPEDCIITVEY